MKDASVKIAQSVSPYLFRNGFILRDLPERDLDILHNNVVTTGYHRGDILFKQGAFPKGVYWLVTGKVKIFQESNGSRQTHYIYSNDDLIGHRQFIAEEANPVSAVLLEDSTVRFIPGTIFKNLLDTSPHFTRNMLTAISKEFSVWMNRMTVFQKYTVHHRLIITLLILSQQYNSAVSPGAIISITRTDLAEYVGASLETVVRLMNKLKSEGLVSINGRQIHLRDPGQLLILFEREKWAVSK